MKRKAETGQDWKVRAELVGSSVWVTARNEEWDLTRTLGIGKGNLSRGEATYGLEVNDSLGKMDKINRAGDREHEHIQLGLHEAFYAAFERHLLSVEERGRRLGRDESWTEFSRRDRDFAARYVAYLWFRSRGWIARSGLKVGADFVLYEEHDFVQHHTHSHTLVLLNGLPSERGDTAVLSWSKLMAAQRIAASVKKKVLVCHIHGDLEAASRSAEEAQSRLWISAVGLSRCEP